MTGVWVEGLTGVWASVLGMAGVCCLWWDVLGWVDLGAGVFGLSDTGSCCSDAACLYYWGCGAGKEYSL